jgi:hypothetical protein
MTNWQKKRGSITPPPKQEMKNYENQIPKEVTTEDCNL